MSGRGRLSRWAVPIFLLAFATTLAELSWWTVFNLRNVRRLCADQEASLHRDAALAATLLRLPTDLPTDLSADRAALQPAALAPLFANLVLGEDGSVRPSPAALGALQRTARAHTRMFVAEGSFFAATMVVGLVLILRALRGEVAAVRKEQNFLAAVTHELKSPLASLRLWTETLLRRDFALADRNRYLGFVLRDVDRLENLIGNVLTAARLQGPPRRPTAAPPPLDLAPQTLTTVQGLQAQASAKGVQLRYASDAGAYAAIDPDSWSLIVRNLVDNAIKYSAGASEVDIRLRARDTHVTFEVVDHGTGLAADELVPIFDKFYRVGNEMVRGSEGTGLGLFLVRRVAAQHGATVQAFSDGLGKGARFVVRFERPAPPLSPLPPNAKGAA